VAEDQSSGGEASQGGVFGNLPESRPGIRSPRRRSTAGDQGPREGSSPARSAPEPPASSAPEAAEPAPRPAPPPSSSPPEDEAGREHGIEDLAWAGVAAAAEAATIGVRLASRAMEALRGPAEPR
jgi:hypothetical protein